jgi:hypothetical protein
VSWQEKAVKAAERAYQSLATDAPMEAALRAALPLIEVTPAMNVAGLDGFRAMLTACANEEK